MTTVDQLGGHAILVVEDEPLVALGVHGALHDAGASILAASNNREALDLIGYARISAAIVDVNLGSADCTQVCAALSKRAIPFVFYTGYALADATTTWSRAPILNKPAQPNDVVDALELLLSFRPLHSNGSPAFQS